MEQRYVVTKLTTSTPLHDASSSFYREFTIENFYGEMLYILNADGEICELPPYPHPTAVKKRVVLNIRTKKGFTTPGVRADLTQVITSQSPKYPIDRFELNVEALATDAVYIEEAGIAIATALFKERLSEVHRLNNSYYRKMFSELTENYFNQGWPVPCVVTANTHREDVDYLFTSINGLITSVKVRHDLNTPEHVTVTINRAERHLESDVDYDFEKGGLFEDTIQGTNWLFSTNREDIVKRVESDKQNLASRLSASEVKSKISEALDETTAKIEELTTENEQLKKELQSVKKDLSLAQSEVEKANAASKFTTEQQMQMMRLNTAIAEQQAAQERKEMIREQTLLKGQADAEIARAKVAKEELSVQNAEVSNFGLYAKTAAVLAPLAVGAGMWVKSMGAAAAAGSVIAGPLGAIAAPLCAGVAAFAAGGSSIITSVCNAVGSVISGVWDFICDTVGSVVDWIFG